MALSEITKGMSNAAEVINDNFNQLKPSSVDTGYLPLTYVNGYKGNTETTGTYRKIGKMVEVIFNVTNMQMVVSPNLHQVFAILPSGFRPPKGFSFLARTNGTAGKNPMKCEILASGELMIVSNGDNSVVLSDWATGQITFFVE